MTEKLIFEQDRPGRRASAQAPAESAADGLVPEHLSRRSALGLPAASEMDTVRHYTRLSQMNFAIDTNFYPLGFVHDEVQPARC